MIGECCPEKEKATSTKYVKTIPISNAGRYLTASPILLPC